VRAGSIVPVGPAIQYTGEKPDAPVTLLVYTGADGSFTLYEDQGTNTDYQQGAYTTIPISYDQATGTLTIGRRSGQFPGMQPTRTFRIRWITPQARPGDDFSAPPDRSAEYSGAPIQLHCQSCSRRVRTAS